MEQVSKDQTKNPLPFRAGDTVEVGWKIKEGEASRVQKFAGVVMAKKGGGLSETFTVRKIASSGVAVEKIFPLHSPLLDSLKVIKEGKARRAKLYYLRNRS